MLNKSETENGLIWQGGGNGERTEELIIRVGQLRTIMGMKARRQEERNSVAYIRTGVRSIDLHHEMGRHASPERIKRIRRIRRKTC